MRNIDEMDRINISYEGCDFPSTMRRIRTALGYTQEGFSKRLKEGGLKISSSTLRSYEQGKRLPQSPIIFIKNLRETLNEELNSKGVIIKIIID